MTNILIQEETIPGAASANSIMAKLATVGIRDVKLMYDDQVKPKGMWAVVQIQGQSNLLFLPKSYNETNLQPYLLWWCKNERAEFRPPNDQDLMNIITVVKRAPAIWDKGEGRADHFDQLDAERDRKHREKLHDKVHTIAPAMKKALQKGNL